MQTDKNLCKNIFFKGSHHPKNTLPLSYFLSGVCIWVKAPNQSATRTVLRGSISWPHPLERMLRDAVWLPRQAPRARSAPRAQQAPETDGEATRISKGNEGSKEPRDRVAG